MTHPIEAESYRILAERVDLDHLGPLGRAVVARIVHATADTTLVPTMNVDEGALAAGIAALRAGAPLVCDVEMVRGGITGADARCYLAEVPAADPGDTRAAAAMRLAAARHPEGAVFVVGCAPTALAALCEEAAAGRVRPALVIGLPVGFVGAAEAKDRLRRSGLPVLTNTGERGGSAMAAAAANALVRLAREREAVPAPSPAPPSPGERPALLLVGHGSRSPAGVADYWRFAAVLRGEAPWLEVGCGFIELAEPDLDTAIDRLVAGGATSVVAVPLVLLGAGHLKNDGPAALARGRRRHPHVRFAYGRDLGIHPAVLEVAEDRIRATLAGDDPADWAVVVVSRGSTDPDANADLHKVARLLWDSRGTAAVEPAFVSLAPPSVPDALERCRRLGFRRMAVVPYFLFTGVLVERIHAQSAAWAASHPDVEVRVGPYLGPDPRIARLVLARYREATEGTALMNCDCCIYRVALPGYEHRVGAPVPVGGHHHGHHGHHGRHDHHDHGHVHDDDHERR